MTTEAPETHDARPDAARERMGLNQTELGVTGSDIYRNERDQVSIRPMALRQADALEARVDYLLGLSNEQNPATEELARKYAQADEEQLLIWLEEKSPELAEYMRALRSIPEEEQQGILEAMASDMRAIHSGQAVYTKVSADE
jgi:hypothetical protein